MCLHRSRCNNSVPSSSNSSISICNSNSHSRTINNRVAIAQFRILSRPTKSDKCRWHRWHSTRRFTSSCSNDSPVWMLIVQVRFENITDQLLTHLKTTRLHNFDKKYFKKKEKKKNWQHSKSRQGNCLWSGVDITLYTFSCHWIFVLRMPRVRGIQAQILMQSALSSFRLPAKWFLSNSQ